MTSERWVRHRDRSIWEFDEAGERVVPMPVEHVRDLLRDAGYQPEGDDSPTTIMREAFIDLATWISEQTELDVASPDEAVDMFIASRQERDTAAAGQVSGQDPRIWSPVFLDVAKEITYKPLYRLLLLRDQALPGGRWYFQIECHRTDAITGHPGVGRGGKAYLSPHASRSEITQTAFGLFKAYEEHECREWFRFAGAQVFGPHIDVLALHGIADQTEHRGVE